MISFRHNFIFVHVGKTGGNSIQEVLQQYSEAEISASEAHQDGLERFDVRQSVGGVRLSKHSAARDYHDALGAEAFGLMRKIVVTRNPYDRMISRCFFRQKQITFRQQGKRANPVPFEAVQIAFKPHTLLEVIERSKPIEDFVCLDRSDGPLLQTAAIDTFLRFSHLQDDFDMLMSELALPRAALAVRNRTEHRHFAEYYTPKTRDLVARRFHREIEAFGYECK